MDRNLFDTRESISVYLVSNLFKSILDKAEKGNFPTLDSVNKEFNILWSKIRKKITFNVTSNDYVIFQSFTNRLLRYMTSTFSKLEVIVNDQLFDFQLTNSIIKIPLSVVRSMSDVYVYYIDDGIFYQDIPSGYFYLAPIVYRLGREICKGHRYGMRPVIYRSQHLRTYQCIDNSRVVDLLDNLTKGIELGINYPKVSIQSCKFCQSKDSCSEYPKTN